MGAHTPKVKFWFIVGGAFLLSLLMGVVVGSLGTL